MKWRREATDIPTPADILKIIRENIRWESKPDYKAAKEQKAPPVTWCFKTWGEYTQADKTGLRKHLDAMDAVKRKTYLGYLKHWCFVPEEAFQ